MPGRTLATWYGSGGQPSDSTFHPSAPPFYGRPPQPGGQYEQPSQHYDTNYGYYPNVNQPSGNSGTPTNYPDQQRNYSSNYPPQPTQYTPQSPASPNYYSNQSQQVQPSHHEMSYPNSQGAYNQSPGQYGSPNHQNSNYPAGGNPWSPQQSAADYTHHASSSPQQQVMTGSPVATPSPAHTPSSTGPINSPPPAMPGQYPAHHHARHSPMGGSPPAPGHGHPAWNHPGQQGLSMHPGQPSGYYPPPHGPMVPPGRSSLPPGPPQHAHMASDRHSPHHSTNPAAWNSVSMPKTADGRLPPPTSHPQNNGGPGNPLFNLQMLVNQDMNRTAQVNVYRGTPPTAETVDLSSTGTADVPQSAPIPLTRTDKPPEHSTVRNGAIPSSTVTNSNIKSPPTPLNGDVSSDSGLSSSTSTPSGPPEAKDNKDIKEIGVIAQNPLAKVTLEKKMENQDSESAEKRSRTGDVKAVIEDAASKAASENRVERSSPVIRSSLEAEVSVVSSSKSEENLADNLTIPVIPGLSISPVRSPKSNLKRTKKVDSILENLVESGTIKMGAEAVAPAPVAVASVIVSRDNISGEDGIAREVCPVSPSPLKETRGRNSPEGEEERSSPASMEDENGKPRRKRKLDKPLRVSKTDSEPLVPVLGKVNVVEGVRTEGVKTKAEIKEMPEVSSTNMIFKMDEPGRDFSNEPTDTTRRRSSSECSESSSHLHVPKIRRRSESDQVDSQKLSVEPKNSFTEVESELEKMFAGIEETGCSVAPVPIKPVSETPIKSEVQTPVSDAVPMEVTPVPKTEEGVQSASTSETKASKASKRGRPKGSKNDPRSSESIGDMSSAEVSRKKKKKQTRKRTDDTPISKKKLKGTKLYSDIGDSNGESAVLKRLGVRDVASREDSGSNASTSKLRGPVIHIEGPKENPYSLTVINAPAQDDEGEKPKKPPSSRRKSTYHSDLDYRGKVCPTVFSSTLSAKYDANTPDPTWMCVFCKCRPHSNIGQSSSANGDLFGPYFVTKDKTEAGKCAEASADDREINEEQKKGGRNKKSIRKSEMVEQFRQKMSKKAKRSQSFENAPVYGMLVVPETPETKGETYYEVWFHEDCFVWASGTRIVGSHLYGLQDAVWNAVPIVCSKCDLGGAVIGCIIHNCQWRLHYHCAQELGWDLDPNTFIARCEEHRVKQEAGPSSVLKLSR